MLIVHDESCELSAHQYAGTLQLQDYHSLTRFRLDPFPVFTSTFADVEAASFHDPIASKQS
jgi:hypothetical protein